MRSEASNAAASSKLRLVLPASAAGRSSGVMVRKVKIPEMSGSPCGVRCTDSVCAATGAAMSATVKPAMPAVTRLRLSMSVPRLLNPSRRLAPADRGA